MAASGTGVRSTHSIGHPRLFWLAALVAAGLSLAAALAGLLTGGDSSGSSPAAGRAAAAQIESRQQRIAFFEARAAADSLDVTSLNLLAGEYLQRARETGDVGDYERAEAAATRSLQVVSRDNYNGLYYLASVKLARHDFVAARELAQSAIDNRPALGGAYGIKGDAELNLGLYDDASRSYEAMIQRDAGLPALSRMAGLAYLRGNLPEAERLWQQAIAAGKDSPLENQLWARCQLAGVYFGQGDLKGAEKQLNAALKLNPDYVHALAGLAGLRAAQGRWDDAVQLYGRAQDMQPVPQYVMALVDVYVAAGRPADAEAQSQIVEAIDTLYRANGVNTDLPLAVFYADHATQIDRGFDLAGNAYASAPGIYAADALAWTLYAQGRYAEARPLILEAMRLGTPDASLFYHAGMIFQALGETDTAWGYLRRALDINPHFSVVHADQARKVMASMVAKR